MHDAPSFGPGPYTPQNLCLHSMFILFPSRGKFVSTRLAGLPGQFSLVHSQRMVD